eukprot:1518131-Ditylum_brightwellii.AAC.2
MIKGSYIATNPIDNKEEGSKVISEMDREDKPDPKEVELVFEKAAEGEEVNISLGFYIGADARITISEIEVPEPGFAPVNHIPIREVSVEKTKGEAVLTLSLTLAMIFHAEILLGCNRRVTTTPGTTAGIHNIK